MENQWNITAIIDRYRLPIDHHDFNLALPNYRNERSPRQWWWMVYSFCTDSDSRAISGTKPLMIQIKHTIFHQHFFKHTDIEYFDFFSNISGRHFAILSRVTQIFAFGQRWWRTGNQRIELASRERRCSFRNGWNESRTRKDETHTTYLI